MTPTAIITLAIRTQWPLVALLCAGWVVVTLALVAFGGGNG